MDTLIWERHFCPFFGGYSLVGGSNHYRKHHNNFNQCLEIEVVLWWEGPS